MYLRGEITSSCSLPSRDANAKYCKINFLQIFNLYYKLHLCI